MKKTLGDRTTVHSFTSGSWALKLKAFKNAFMLNWVDLDNFILIVSQATKLNKIPNANLINWELYLTWFALLQPAFRNFQMFQMACKFCRILATTVKHLFLPTVLSKISWFQLSNFFKLNVSIVEPFINFKVTDLIVDLWIQN